MSEPASLYPILSQASAKLRDGLAQEPADAFRAFSKAVFAAGALPAKTKQLVAVAVAHTTQCPYCIRAHTGAALREGATAQEIVEAVWVAAEMRAGAAYAHSALAFAVIAEQRADEPHEARAT